MYKPPTQEEKETYRVAYESGVSFMELAARSCATECPRSSALIRKMIIEAGGTPRTSAEVIKARSGQTDSRKFLSSCSRKSK